MPRLENHPRVSAALTVLMAVAALVLAWGHETTTLAHASVGGATGPLVADSLGGGAILSARNMVPGAARVGEVTVTNDGDTEGGMNLRVADISNVMGHGLPLSSLLDLTVVDVTAGHAPRLVYSGKLDGLGGVALGTYQQGEAHRYRFLVSFPETPDDNAYSASSTTVSFVWTATQNDVAAPTPPAVDVPVTPATVDGSDPATIVDTVEQSRNPGALKLRVYVRRTQAAHRKRVYVNAFCSRGCKLTATGVASLPSRHKTWKLKTLKRTMKAGATAKFRMALPKKSLRTLNTALLHHKRASVKLKITATAGGKTLRWTRTIRLAR